MAAEEMAKSETFGCDGPYTSFVFKNIKKSQDIWIIYSYINMCIYKY